MDIKVTNPDEPQQNVATITPESGGGVATTAVVEAPPAPTPTPTVTEPAIPPATPDPLPGESDPVTEPPTPESAGAGGPTSPLTRTPIPEKKKSKPMLVIIIALVVFLALAAVVIYVFMKRDKGAPTPAVSQNQTAPKVSSSDVNSASQNIDKSLQTIDDTKDFNSNDVSDATLGL